MSTRLRQADCLDAHADPVRVEHCADLLRRIEVAAHQRQALGQGHHPDHTVLDTRLLNDQSPARQSPARPKHAQQIGEGGARVDEVVERIDHDHAVEACISDWSNRITSPAS